MDLVLKYDKVVAGIIKFQATVRGYLTRSKLRRGVYPNIDIKSIQRSQQRFGRFIENQEPENDRSYSLAQELYPGLNQLLSISNKSKIGGLIQMMNEVGNDSHISHSPIIQRNVEPPSIDLHSDLVTLSWLKAKMEREENRLHQQEMEKKLKSLVQLHQERSESVLRKAQWVAHCRSKAKELVDLENMTELKDKQSHLLKKQQAIMQLLETQKMANNAQIAIYEKGMDEREWNDQKRKLEIKEREKALEAREAAQERVQQRLKDLQSNLMDQRQHMEKLNHSLERDKDYINQMNMLAADHIKNNIRSRPSTSLSDKIREEEESRQQERKLMLERVLRRQIPNNWRTNVKEEDLDNLGIYSKPSRKGERPRDVAAHPRKTFDNSYSSDRRRSVHFEDDLPNSHSTLPPLKGHHPLPRLW
eukprot:NODE_2984_length_1446_cov_43.619048_g2589_i0.p1 GENE.NODE_2984_length_1446_cov_43.619048_g2589_i0~~NODE_2984_length_1446_cov_43.619048_g2589_i0.p1  ORF type:complete len:418 (-),score=85.09 NODE_2984_length_1446_cov_43.619048_g2589_i0:93-1346(-)